MAPVASVGCEVVSGVTRCACGIMVSVQYKELVMVKRGGLPSLWAVALSAVTRNLAVQGIGRRLMATLTMIQNCFR